MKDLSPNKAKILIIRFSSFGDVTQALSLPAKLKEHFSNPEIHWVTRSDFHDLVSCQSDVFKVWSFDRKSGLSGLFKLIGKLRHEKFTHVYDAHNNLRSHLISFFLRLSFGVKFVRKSQKRVKRFFLFQLRKNLYDLPFSGQRDLIEPLKKWGISEKLPPTPQLQIPSEKTEKVRKLLQDKGVTAFVALAPSAAYELKRWPLVNWRHLIERFPNKIFVILGGPEDDFLKDLQLKNSILLAGKTDLLETAAVVQQSQALVANDTGVLHLGEQLGHPSIALMGPAVFGFPSRESTVILERFLYCRPCSKHGQGPCVNPEFQKCLRDISVEEVAGHLSRIAKL